MRFLALGLAALLLCVPGCGGGRRASAYAGELISDYNDPGLKPLRDELRPLPFHHDPVWYYKLTDKEIARITLGSEFLYVETPDHRIVAMDRFNGVVKWIYEVDTRTPLDWPPIEAYGVPDEIRQKETELRAAKRKVEDIVKEKGPGKESQEQQKKVDNIREQLRQAQNGDNVYFISQHVMYCLVRTTGTLLWSRRLSHEFSASGQPFAIRSDIFVPGGNLSRVWRLSVEGKGRSVTFYRTSIGSHDKQVTNRPLYEDPALYFVSHDGSVYSYNQDGNLNWTYPTEDELRADPVIYKYKKMYKDPAGKDRPLDTKFLYVGGFDHAFYALDAAGGNLVWKYETAGQIKSPAVARGETVYVKTENGALFALDATPMHGEKPDGSFVVPPVGQGWPWRRSGTLRWKLPLGERFVVKGKDHVYVLGPNREIYKLNEWTGEVIGRYPMNLFQHIVTNAQDDILYLAHPSGHIFALRESKE
jgi:outer membrane protein assembly factor BamB